LLEHSSGRFLPVSLTTRIPARSHGPGKVAWLPWAGPSSLSPLPAGADTLLAPRGPGPPQPIPNIHCADRPHPNRGPEQCLAVPLFYLVCRVPAILVACVCKSAYTPRRSSSLFPFVPFPARTSWSHSRFVSVLLHIRFSPQNESKFSRPS